MDSSNVARSALVIVLACALIVGTAACSDNGDTGSADVDDADLAAFCAEAPGTADEAPESYVGSEEHVDDLRQLVRNAPSELRDDLNLVIEHFDEAVDPADPDSQLIDAFPADVNAAIDRVTAFIDQSCGK